ncbi:MAG: ATP-binding protein [Candidatus Zixiibacteriota bacterium]
MRIWRGLQLRTRLYVILGVLLLIIISIGVSQFIYTFHIQSSASTLYNDGIQTVLTVQELKNTLTSQKGFVSYFVLDKDTTWFDLLSENKLVFDSLLAELERLDRDEQTSGILHQIKTEYIRYDSVRNTVIAEYRAGNFDVGQGLHVKLRHHFLKILELTDSYTDRHTHGLTMRIDALKSQATRVRAGTTAAIGAAIILSALLILLLRVEIFKPIKSLASQLGNNNQNTEPVNEVTELGHQIHGLLEDVDKGQAELQKSRTKLVESEKMAVVGKLAAELAHGIRSPMTSIEMRLYSLEQAMMLDDDQKDNLQAIYNDLHHLDAVIANFLEFSRPPRLLKHKIDIEQPIERALLLLEQKLRRRKIEVTLTPPPCQLFCFADAERLKEVFVNLLVNSCDAIGESGKVSIVVSIDEVQADEHTIIIRISDSGPGIPDAVLEKLWSPFVTTKEDGTGLGLSIAKRIIEEHDGTITANADRSSGAEFIIVLPQFTT